MDIISATKAFKSLCPMKQWGKKKKKMKQEDISK